MTDILSFRLPVVIAISAAGICLAPPPPVDPLSYVRTVQFRLGPATAYPSSLYLLPESLARTLRRLESVIYIHLCLFDRFV